MTKTKKSDIMIVDTEYGVDSGYTSKKEQENQATALMEARLKRMKNLSNEQIVKAKLMQLKLKMEEYLKNPVYDKQNYFSEFLKTYIDSIYSKRSNFAQDIDIAPVSLSQVINKHREPKEEFLPAIAKYSMLAIGFLIHITLFIFLIHITYLLWVENQNQKQIT